MGLSDRRRALMAGGENYTWNPAFGIHAQTTEYYQSGAIIAEMHYYIFVNFAIEDLTGTNSKNVIVCYDDEFGSKIVSIVPRENRKDADISSKLIMIKAQSSYGEVMKTDKINISMLGTFSLLSVYHESIARINESNSYRESYYLTGNPVCDMQNDMIFDYYLNSEPGTSDECPMGGSHDFSAIGQPGSSMPGYQCPSCGQTGYCYQQTTQCTKCGEYSDVVRCQYCGWQT